MEFSGEDKSTREIILVLRQETSDPDLLTVEGLISSMAPRLHSGTALGSVPQSVRKEYDRCTEDLFNRRDAARAGIRIGLGIDDENIGVGTVGDPHLVAIENVATALVLRAQFHADHVGTGVGFAHSQCTHVFAGDQRGQVLPFLLLRTIATDLVDAQV